MAADRDGQFDVIVHRHRRRPVRPGRRRAPRHLPRPDPLRAGPARLLKAGRLPHPRPRVVERKKYGRAKARRSFQFSKR